MTTLLVAHKLNTILDRMAILRPEEQHLILYQLLSPPMPCGHHRLCWHEGLGCMVCLPEVGEAFLASQEALEPSRVTVPHPCTHDKRVCVYGGEGTASCGACETEARAREIIQSGTLPCMAESLRKGDECGT